MMMKRLTAWLLVLCMTLSLLPGTAFAASGGGDDDGLITITYDLNDGKSGYQLQLKTTPGKEPANEPGAVRAGRPFTGWTMDEGGQVAADYSKSTTLYAQWLSGYEVTIDFKEALSGTTTKNYKTDNNGKLNADNLAEIETIIKDFEDIGRYAFDGWYMKYESGTFSQPFGDITNTIEKNGTTLYAKWIPVYQLKFKYNNPNDTEGTPDFGTVTKTGGTLKDLPSAPTYKDDPYTFDGWYIIETNASFPLRNAVNIPSGSILAGQGTGRGVRITTDELATYSFTRVAEDLTNAGVLNGPNNIIKIHANWSVPYGIIFDANGGHFGDDEKNTKTVIKTDNSGVIDNESWPDGEKAPKRTGYKFVEWRLGKKDSNGKDEFDPNGAVVEVGASFRAPTHVYAVWEQQIHVLINYDTAGVANVDIYLDEPGKIDNLSQLLKIPLNRPGFVFDMWQIKRGSGDFKDITDNELAQENFGENGEKEIVIKPDWKKGCYITFDPNGGSFTGSVSGDKPILTDVRYRIEEGDMPKVENTGYHFLGWFTAPTGGTKIGTTVVQDPGNPDLNKTYYLFDTGEAVVSNKTVYAQWGPPYAITLDENGGNLPAGVANPLTSTNDGKFPSLPTPTKDHQKFVEWEILDNNGNVSGVAKAGENCSGPAKLRAKWVGFTITLDPGQGKLEGDSSPKDYIAGDDGTLAILSSTLADVPVLGDTLEFVGWYTLEGGAGNKVDGTTVFSGDTKLYASWKSKGSTTISTTPNKAPAKPSAAPRPPATTAGEPMAIADTAPFNITFDYNGNGTPASTVQTDANGKITDDKWPADPTRTDADGEYEFMGWFRTKSGGTKVEKSETFVENVTLYARWEPVITFNANGGLFPDNRTKIEVTTTGKKISDDKWPVPAQEGFVFDGWYDSDTGGNPVAKNPNYEFDKPTKLYAHWKRIEYTISFDRNDGTNTIITQTTVDGKVTNIPDLAGTREGYEFDAWYTAKEGGNKVDTNYAFGADTTVYARWIKDITVTFVYNDGTDKTEIKTVDKNTHTVVFPDDPNYGGHRFDGWYSSPNGGTKYDAATNFTEDTTVYANWSVQEHTITWDLAKDATGNDIKDVTPASYAPTTTVGGKILDIHKPTRPGKWFDHWVVESIDGANPDNPIIGESVTEDTIFYGNATLKSVWKDISAVTPDENDTVITFIVDVPEPLEDAAHFIMVADTNGRLQHLPELLMAGVDSDGWRLENSSTKVTLGEVYGDDTNLYVNITETFLITLDWNNAKDGGTSTTTTVRVNNEHKIDPDKWPDPEGRNPGYYFDNWYTEATGGIVVPQTKIFDGPTTIYAHWKGPFTVTFDANGGKFQDGTTEIKIETDDDGNLDRALIPEDPTREGYGSFKGWSLTEDGTEAVEPDAKPYDGAATLYAIWGPPYDITYDAMGGEVTPTEEQLKSTEEGKYPELPVPTHTRDSFGGWYTTQDYQEGTQATAGGDCPGAVTLYAKWTREPPYTITFEANREGATMEDPDSGAAVTTITLKTDDKGVLMKAPPEPMLRGGKFQGWYTKAEEGTGDLVADAATRTYTDDMTLYAHWETMEFKITFDFNLSTILSNPTNVTTYTTTKGGSLTYLPGDLPQASSGDKKISGWYRVPNPTAKDQPVTKSDVFYRDTTLYAQWVDADDPPIVFKYPNITFMNEDGNKAMITLEVDTDYKLATFPEPPYKEGHTFTGWVTRDPDGTEHPLTSDTLITGSLVAYPKYAQKGYTITFEPGEETELDPTKVTTTSEGRIPDGSMPDDPVWEGHTFNGWYTSATGGTKINRRTVFTQDTTVYAHWDGSDGETPSGEYTITFDADGGSVTPTSATTVNGKLQILPTPTKSGYTFDGWYNGSSAVTVDTVYTADTTLTAHWKSDGGSDGPSSAPYTITFNPNGGNLETAATALTDLQGRLMSIPTPRRTGYSFDGWYNGTERVTTATVFTKNTEVVARWTTGSGGGSGSDSGTNGDNGYTVTVNNNSGGRVSVSTTYAREGDRVTVTIRPYTGYQLDQINVTNARGYDVSLRDQGGNRYTFYMPASRVTVDATFMELIANGNGNGDNGGNNGGNTGGNTGGSTGGNGGTGGTLNPITPPVTSGNGVFSEPVLNTVPMPYVDVTPSAWYYSSVDYMWQRSLMGGVSANRFGPQATTSNAMIWTILARLAGVDVTAGGGIWYENARSWAVSNRISDGVGPNNAVTREQLATMLWNYRGSPAASYDLGRFGDRGQISTYQAENALRWAVANNIVSGSGNRLNPRGTATRAEVAAMITRFCQNT